MSPDGAVLLRGYGTYSLYFKDLFEKLAIDTHVFRVGTYKSFVEPYTRTGMSKEAKTTNAVWLNQLWGAFITDIAKNREIKVESLSPSSESLLKQLKAVDGDFAALSKELGLVDELLPRPEMRKRLAEQFGSDGKTALDTSAFTITPTPPLSCR